MHDEDHDEKKNEEQRAATRGLIHCGRCMHDDHPALPKLEKYEEREFKKVKVIVNMIECLADLLELQAMTTKGIENEREFFELFNMISDL